MVLPFIAQPSFFSVNSLHHKASVMLLRKPTGQNSVANSNNSNNAASLKGKNKRGKEKKKHRKRNRI